MNQLYTFFESIDLEAIRRFVKERRQEDLHLDFKLVADGRKVQPSDRRTLAKAISSFANSEGGVVVWGVEATRGDDEIDAATRLVPLKDPKRILSELQSYTGSAASPIVDGVVHELIMDNGDQGYVKTFVPVSDGGPHMAKLREDRYYKRSGDSFRKMEHFDIADMFGRRLRPVLSLVVDIRVGKLQLSTDGNTYRVAIHLGIRNSGRGVARFPSLALRVKKPHALTEFGIDGNRYTGLPQLPRSYKDRETTFFAGGADHVVHVDTVLDITRIALEVPEPDRSVDDVEIDYRISALGVRPIEDTRVMTRSEIIKCLPPLVDVEDS